MSPSLGFHPRTAWAALRLQWQAAPVASTVALGITGGTGAMAAIGAWLTKQLFDELGQPSPDRSRALGFALATAIAGGAAMMALHLTAYVNIAVRRRVALEVDRTLFARIIAFETLEPFENPAFHGRLRMAEQAARDAPQQIADLVQALLRSTVTAATLTGVVWTVSPVLAAIIGVVGLAGLATRVWRTRREAVMEADLVGNHRWRDFYRGLMLDVRAAREIRLFGLGPLLLGRMTDTMERAARRELGVERDGAIVAALLTAATASVTAIGAWLVVDGAVAGRFGVGDVTLFLAAVAGVQGAFTGLVNQVGHAGRVLLLFESYLAVIDLPLDAPTDAPARLATVPPLQRGIELRDVWFRYGPDRPWVLRGVDLFVPRGRSLGLVGVNGAGKSTLVKLLCRFHDPERGRVLWDGTDVRDFEPEALRARMAATFQDFMTYDLTAAENIGLGHLPRLHDEEAIRAAAALVGIDDTLGALPAGYRTRLSRTLAGEDDEEDATGVSLSGGQWQRVALARSLMRPDVDLLILDEPSSGLDAEAEHRIHQTLQAHGRGRACLLVSHRLNALRAADAIAVLADGRVVEQGTHDALMASGGAYARLFGLQARGYQLEPLAGVA